SAQIRAASSGLGRKAAKGLILAMSEREHKWRGDRVHDQIQASLKWRSNIPAGMQDSPENPGTGAQPVKLILWQPLLSGQFLRQSATMRAVGRWVIIISLVLVLLCIREARGAGSGLNVVVVVNQNSTNSVQLGNYYAEHRQVPPQNFLRINWPGGNI